MTSSVYAAKDSSVVVGYRSRVPHTRLLARTSSQSASAYSSVGKNHPPLLIIVSYSVSFFHELDQTPLASPLFMVYDRWFKSNGRCAKALDRGSARLCCLAKDCENPEYTQLVRALCDEGNVHLIMVSSARFNVGVSPLPVSTPAMLALFPIRSLSHGGLWTSVSPLSSLGRLVLIWGGCVRAVFSRRGNGSGSTCCVSGNPSALFVSSLNRLRSEKRPDGGAAFHKAESAAKCRTSSRTSH